MKDFIPSSWETVYPSEGKAGFRDWMHNSALTAALNFVRVGG